MRLGPAPYRRVRREFAENLESARWVYAAEIAVGALIASQQTPEK